MQGCYNKQPMKTPPTAEVRSLLRTWLHSLAGTMKSVTDCITLFALATGKLRALCMPLGHSIGELGVVTSPGSPLSFQLPFSLLLISFPSIYFLNVISAMILYELPNFSVLQCLHL